MLKFIDNLLNRITMYRLVLFSLIFILGAALLLSFAHVLAYDPYAMLFSTAFLLVVCALTNWVFARVFEVPTNEESAYITALILALIITPIQSLNDLWFLLWAAVLSMASKYILAIKGKHLFNPAALAVVITYYAINQSASWWVGDASLLLPVIITGLLIVRKLRRFDMVLTFLATALVVTLFAALFTSADMLQSLQRTMLYSPLFFFATVMLTEPLTTPPTRQLRIIYGALIGLLFTPLIHLGSFYLTPELGLIVGNVFSYIVSPKTKLVLRLKQKVQIARDAYEFTFTANNKLAFAPGQYMEWTLDLNDSDSRGNRRYFTLASSPTEQVVRLGVKFYQKSSAFKRALLALPNDGEIVAAQLAGDFVLPDDSTQKCVFIAGGIGITPFRSMLQYLLDTHQRRPITVFYANRTFDEIVYTDVLTRAAQELGIRTIYTLTDTQHLPDNWRGLAGRISAQWIKKYVPDYLQRVFYLSGPLGMIDNFKSSLRELGVRDSHIRTDYFSGLS